MQLFLQISSKKFRYPLYKRAQSFQRVANLVSYVTGCQAECIGWFWVQAIRIAKSQRSFCNFFANQLEKISASIIQTSPKLPKGAEPSFLCDWVPGEVHRPVLGSGNAHCQVPEVLLQLFLQKNPKQFRHPL